MADSIPGRRIEPSIPLTDSRFQYTPAASTDIRKTFERVRAQQLTQSQAGKTRRNWGSA
jgi:hypothetical protein